MNKMPASEIFESTLAHLLDCPNINKSLYTIILITTNNIPNQTLRTEQLQPLHDNYFR